MAQADWTPEKLAGIIDFAFLKQFATAERIERHCELAVHYNFALVAIHPCEVERCYRLLQGSPVRVGAVTGFPLGQNTSAVKEYEAADAIQRGASEIDMMINLRALRTGEGALVREEISRLVKVCRRAGATSKVILETCYLDEHEKETVCHISLEEGADFVKTSTGFGPAGAALADVRWMRQVVGPTMGVKAAGGIRDLAAAMGLIDAGATRLGTSRGGEIIEELIALNNRTGL
jgi:deoxyribose-phosphate aldolase